jgi:hypothetical protein
MRRESCSDRPVVISDVCQEFLGRKYFLCGKYYQDSANVCRLHRMVWEHFSGESIPEGYDVHHEDFDRSNNQYENLILVERGEHHRLHLWMRTKDMSQEEKSALTLVAREAARAWHSSPEGLEWHRKHYEECSRDALTARSEMVCENPKCGKLFQGAHGSKFCSNNCKSQWRRDAGLDDEDRTCPICGKVFRVNRYARAKTCSRSCGRKTIVWKSRKR